MFVPFHFDKSRVLTRQKLFEIAEGTIDRRPFLLYSSLNRDSAHQDYIRQAGIHHSLLLQPQFAFSKRKYFRVAIPLDFRPEIMRQEYPHLPSYAMQILSLLYALRQKNWKCRWNLDSVLFDSERKTVKIPAVKFDTDNPPQIRSFFEKNKAPAALIKILRKLENPKASVSECLRELMESSNESFESLITIFEEPRENALDLVSGLYQLVNHEQSRTVVFSAESGSGKTVLLRQMFQHFAFRHRARVIWHSAFKQDRPLASIRAFFEHCYECLGEFPAFHWDASEQSADAAVSAFLQIIGRNDNTIVILIDDLDHFDEASFSLLCKLLRSCSTAPILFVFTSRKPRAFHDVPVIASRLEPLGSQAFEKNCIIPLWDRDQSREYIRYICERTSGNPQLFRDYLVEVLKQQHRYMRWTEEGWKFSRNEIPQFPQSISDFYFQQLPLITPPEQSVLELISAAEISGGVGRLPADAADPGVMRSLLDKQVLANHNDQIRFRNPQIAEAIYNRMDPHRMKAVHRWWSDTLKSSGSENSPSIAQHLLRAGDYQEALKLASDASSSSMLPVFQALSQHSEDLLPDDRLTLFRQQGLLYFHSANYPAAVSNFERAMEFTRPQTEQRFSVAVLLAQSLLGCNQILKAHSLLQEQNGLIPRIRDQKVLADYYFARGTTLWHRGERNTPDFQNAIAIAEEMQDYNLLARSYRQRAELLLREGNYAEARVYSQKTIRYCARTKNIEQKAHAFRVLGTAAWYESRYKAAERLWKRSLHFFQKSSNVYGEARILSLLGNIYTERCRFDPALKALHKAIHLMNRQEHPDELGVARFNLGVVFIEQGKLKEAERIFERCRIADKKSGNRRYYAYDLRALAVVSIQHGFYKKAGRLLRRTLEICHELHAEVEIVQTKVIQILNELEQSNYRVSQELADWLEERLSAQEPRTASEIEYLIGWHYGYINDTKQAQKHLDHSLELAKKARHYKQIAKSLVMRQVFCPAGKINASELKAAFRFARISGNELEFFDHLLKMYLAHPYLLREKTHMKRLMRMEKLYRSIHHRPKHRMIRELIQSNSKRKTKVEPLYEWWQSLLHMFQQETDLHVKLNQVLKGLQEELSANAAVIEFVNENGVIERESVSQFADDVLEKIRERMRQFQKPLCLGTSLEPDLIRLNGVLVQEVRSILSVPIASSNQLIGIWYFERRSDAPLYTARDLQKLSFFCVAAHPLLENALKQEWTSRAGKISESFIFEDLIGSSKKMQELSKSIQQAAPLDISVLVLGESGTGKEVIARNIHRQSKRASKPFQAVNCSAIPETLIESELFGYTKGAFTGATAAKPGLIEQANGGTLFLDEIGDLSLAAQAKLLRVLQEREILRLGETSTRKMDIRLICATHKDLKKLVRENAFRQDLFYRISTYMVNVPALRERKEDIPLLLQHLIRKFSSRFGKENVSFSPSAMKALTEYSWSGNVREMENFVQSLLVNCRSDHFIEAREISSLLSSDRFVPEPTGISLEEARDEFERKFLVEVLKKHGWNKTHAARELKITRQGLIGMIQRLGITEE